MSVEIIHDDCLHALEFIPSAIADCGLADPPYGDTSLKWDKPVKGWVPALARALKPNCSIWVFGSMKHLMRHVFPEMDASGFKYAQDIVWEKQNGTGFHADRFRRVHEHAVQFYRGKWANVFKAPQYTLDARKKTVRRKTRPTHTGHIEMGHYVSEDGGPRLMRSVQQVRNEHGRAEHPTQKPELILEPLLLYSCPPGGLVIDPFFGSGSTGLVAQKHDRGCIGIEADERFIEVARRRLALHDGVFA